MSNKFIYDLNLQYSFEFDYNKFIENENERIQSKLYENHGSYKDIICYFWESLTPEKLRDLADKLEEFKNDNEG